MPGSTAPRHVLERLLLGISQDRWHELYAEDAVVDYPFALPTPSRLEGRGAIQRYFAAVARMDVGLASRDVVLRETDDPEVVVVEYGYDGVARATGQTFQVSNIQVTRVRDGEIVASRDYHDHLVMAEATGRLAQLVSALTGSSD